MGTGVIVTLSLPSKLYNLAMPPPPEVRHIEASSVDQLQVFPLGNIYYRATDGYTILTVVT